MGKARVPALLAQSWIEVGRLAETGAAVDSRHAYWLVAPRPQWRQKKVRELVEFLVG